MPLNVFVLPIGFTEEEASGLNVTHKELGAWLSHVPESMPHVRISKNAMTCAEYGTVFKVVYVAGGVCVVLMIL